MKLFLQRIILVLLTAACGSAWGQTVALSSVATAPSAVCPSTVNKQLYQLTLTASVSTATVTAVTVSTTGTATVPTDIIQYKLWQGSIGGTLLGTNTIPTFGFSNIAIPNGSSVTFFITADFASGATATNGHNININPTGPGNFTTTSGTKVGAGAAGGVQTIDKPVVAAIAGNAPVCQGTTSSPLTDATNAPPGTWTSSAPGIASIGNSTGIITGVTAGTSTITYNYTDGSGCSNIATTTATVNPLPVPPAITGLTSVCEFSNVTLGPAGGTWSSSNTAVGTIDPSSGNFGGILAGTTVISDTVTNGFGCKAFSTQTETVKPTPVLSPISSYTVCNTVAVPASNYIITSSVATPDTSFNWTTNNTNIFTGGAFYASGTTSFFPSYTSANATAGITTGTVTVTASSLNGCSTSTSFDISVYPTPTINQGTSQTLPAGGTTTAINSAGSTDPLTNYTWVNSMPSIGLANTGTGAVIAPFTASNSSAVIDTAYITVTPHINGCNGAPAIDTIIVNPIPGLSSPATAVVCDGLPFNYTATSATTGASFSWSRAAVAGITPPTSSGASATISETLTNTTPNPIAVSYVYTITANGVVNTATVVLTVNPTPHLNSTLAPTRVCNNVSFDYPPSSATLDSSFTWSRNAITGISNAARSGRDNPNEALTNTTDTIIPVAYYYTITSNGCIGKDTVIDSVYPTPRLSSAPFNFYTCDSAVFQYFPSSPPMGITPVYTWVMQPAAGIASSITSGIGNVNVAMINSGNFYAPVVFTYTITVNGCSSTQTIVDTVLPSPKLNVIATTPICNNERFIYTMESLTPAVTYNWQVNGGNSGSTNPISEVLTNGTAIPVTRTITITLFNSPHAECKNSQTISVTVNPTPNITSAAPAAICSGTPFSYQPTSSTGDPGTSYTWSITSVSNISASKLFSDPTDKTGLIKQDTISSNETQSPISLTLNYTLTSSHGCANNNAQLLLTVNPTPNAPVIAVAPSSIVDTTKLICKGSNNLNFGVEKSTQSALHYVWASNPPENIDQNTVDSQATKISFATAGTHTVSVSANFGSYPQCMSRSQTIVFIHDTDVVTKPTIYYGHGMFVCLSNKVEVKARGYLWGFDSLLTPSPQRTEINQNFYYPGYDSLTAKKLVWVITTDTPSGCIEKTYYTPSNSPTPKARTSTSLSVYPNPASDAVTIDIKAYSLANTLVAIYDLSGNNIAQAAATQSLMQFVVKDYKPGSYLVVCRQNGNVIASSSFVKN